MTSALNLSFAARTDVGKVRAKNDDSGYAGRHLAVVADGMGGHAGGDVASASTVLELIHLDHDNYQGDAGIQLADEIQTANSLLTEIVNANPKLTGMGTTVTSLLLSGNKLAFAHIGDSRAYRLKNGVFEQMSTDHTFVQRLLDEGRLTPEEAEVHPHKNVLLRVLGDVDASPELDLTTFDAHPGERWVLCSDGLNFVPLPIVEAVVRNTPSLAETADKLIELTLEAGAPDNVTVVVVEVVEADSGEVDTDQFSAVSEKTELAKSTAEETTPADEETSSPKAGTEKAATDPDEAANDSSAEKETRGLGDYIVEAAIEKELANRPHEIVGSAATAYREGTIPEISSTTRRKGAASLLTHQSDDDAAEVEAEDEYILTEPIKRRRWFSITITVILLLIVVAGAWFAYAWTQSRYYVGEYNGNVAVFNGVSQTLGPIQLSNVYRETDIAVDSLPEFSRQRVKQTLPAATLLDADQIVQDLRLGLVSPPDGSTSNPTDTSSTSPPTSPSPSPSTSSPPASPSAATASRANTAVCSAQPDSGQPDGNCTEGAQ